MFLFEIKFCISIPGCKSVSGHTPTYHVNPIITPHIAIDDVRGFLSGGYKSLRNKDGDLSDRVRLL